MTNYAQNFLEMILIMDVQESTLKTKSVPYFILKKS